MEIKLKDRWDDIVDGKQYLDLDLNEKEFVYMESWIDENNTRVILVVPAMPHSYEVRDSETGEPVRNMTPEESDAVFEFAEEQFEVEEGFE